MATSVSRPYQIVVWGATGFVGRLVCERLAAEYPRQLRVAIAGRNRAKLESLRQEMTQYDTAFQEVPILVADSADRDAIDAVTQSTEVVISCAGPYRKYSGEVVASSAANGTHYLDLCAEIPFIRDNIRRHHETAIQNKAKIVHFCGFDSVPMDLGTLLVVDTIRKRYNTGCQRVEQYIVSSFGGFSGGTAASAVDMNTARSPSEKAAMSDPYCLTPDHLTWLSGKTFPGLKYSREAEGWMVPTTFAQVNVPVVMRSNALAKEPYGKDFVYQEGLRTPNLPLALLAQFFVTLFDVVLEYSFLQRTHAIPAAPNPGSGPERSVQRQYGYWRLLFVGYPEPSKNSDTSPPPAVIAKLEDNQGDPGYWSTSKMLVECALSLILDRDRVQSAAAMEGGVLTPAAAFGLIPLHRLKKSGFVVETLS